MTIDSAAARFTAIFETLREFRLSNMMFEDGECFYPLVDAMTADGRSIDDGEEQMKELAAEIVRALETLAAPANAAEPEVKIMPRGGVERNWWEEYQLLLRRFKKLVKAARQCVEEVDANLAKDDWPVKYRAPFEGLAKLREALPETYEEHKARNTLTIDT